jgi:hypothetical protein
MGTPKSEVGYTSATTRKGDHEVYVSMWWHWEKNCHKIRIVLRKIYI